MLEKYKDAGFPESLSELDLIYSSDYVQFDLTLEDRQNFDLCLRLAIKREAEEFSKSVKKGD